VANRPIAVSLSAHHPELVRLEGLIVCVLYIASQARPWTSTKIHAMVVAAYPFSLLAGPLRTTSGECRFLALFSRDRASRYLQPDLARRNPR